MPAQSPVTAGPPSAAALCLARLSQPAPAAECPKPALLFALSYRAAMELLALINGGLYYLCLPLLWIVRLVWAVVWTLLAPVVFLVRCLVAACVWPFQFAARFEVSKESRNDAWIRGWMAYT
jgi:hypothetical protein